MKYISLFLFSVVTPAFADVQNVNEKTQPFQNSHFYFGARLGLSHYQDACEDNAISCQDNTLGGGIYGGYQLYNWLSFELGATNYGQPDASYSNGNINTKTNGLELSTKLSYPITNTWDLYTRLGTTYQFIDQNSDWHGDQYTQDWKPLVALGVDHKISQRWSLRAEYQFIDGIGNSQLGQADLHYASLGITYHFGQDKLPQLPVVIEPVHHSNSFYFEFDSAQVKADGEIHNLSETLIRNNVSMIQVVGHTDSSGPQQYNQKLSERRAQSVADYFIKNGVKPEQLRVSGVGEKQPLFNNTDEGRVKNRRVEVNYEVIEK
ncbi:OmpA family protein [Vibrio algivorus]|nr:OmpA family protein [Vibrio algivorus]